MKLEDEDFKYTWKYFHGSLGFWKKASEEKRYVLFIVDK